MLEKFFIKEKVVIITGGSGLLGSTFVEAIAEIGGIPVIIDLDTKKANKLSEKIFKKYKIYPLIIKADVTDKNSLKKANSKIMKKFKKIDVLINNAANNPKINKYKDSSFEKLFTNKLGKRFRCWFKRSIFVLTNIW